MLNQRQDILQGKCLVILLCFVFASILHTWSDIINPPMQNSLDNFDAIIRNNM